MKKFFSIGIIVITSLGTALTVSAGSTSSTRTVILPPQTQVSADLESEDLANQEVLLEEEQQEDTNTDSN